MTPPIKIKYDEDREVKIFLNFLQSSKFPQQGKQIFRTFPELERALGEKNKTEIERKLIIKNFIRKFRADHDLEITEAMRISKVLLTAKSERALNKLAELMDYKWSPDHPGYTAIPTILPFCPFGKNLFYFTILSDKHPIVFIAIHEISHMMFYEIMAKIYNKPAEEVIGWTSTYFLKELVAPIIMNQKELKEILGSKDSYGNSFLKHIYVMSDDKIIQITKFFQNLYEHYRYEKKLNFAETLKIMVKIIASITQEIESKNKLWNQCGNKIAENEKKFNFYKEPIKIRLEI